MKRYRYTLIVAVVTIFLLSCIGRSNTLSENETAGNSTKTADMQAIMLNGGASTVHADTVNMGRIKSGELVSKQLKVINGGTDPLVVFDIDKSCGCVDVAYPRHPLKPGEEAAIEIRFDSRGIHGWVYKTVIVKTSAADGNHLIVVTADVE